MAQHPHVNPVTGTPAVHPNASMLGHNPIGSPLSHQGVALHADPRAMSLPYAGASLEPKPASAYLDRSLAQAQQLAAMNAAMAYPYPGMVPPTLGGVPLTPAQQMFADVQARRLEVSGAQLPVLLNRVEGPNEMAEELGRMAQEGVQETLSDEVFSNYQHREIISGCKAHPGDIVEAGSLAALPPPEPGYGLSKSLPRELITAGTLSSLQLEGILYACQRHQTVLPNGNRAGFFLGDGAGVGKGRQISGIVLDNFARGRTKHIWFSMSTDLIVDARRDLSDIGCHVKVIEGCKQLDKETRVFGLPADFKEGVLFSTYATLVSSVQRGGLFGSRQSRLQQLMDWCGGKQFEGCLIFDECHKAKNFNPGKESSSTKVALAVTTIQRLLPKARVVYCSATGVTDVKNMAFMERLGLWGEGAPFRNFEHFMESVQRKGLGVAEMLAMEMKATGMYLSRGLSFRQAQFVTVETELTKDQEKMYDMAAHVWNELRTAVITAMQRTNSSNTRMWTNFWAAHQRFFKQLCMGIKIPGIIAETQRALEEGYCVVLGLQTTGEASLESELNKSGTIKKFVSLCREILLRFVEQNFPTIIEVQNPNPEEAPKEDSWSVTAKTMLLDFAKKIPLPDSPLDEIIDKLGGPDKVAEMTGRRGRIVRRSPRDPPTYEHRESDGEVESLNVRERNLFMSGKKLVAIISDAASTGISLHADVRAGNQRRRIHMTIELPWSADKAVQQLGRSHRSNQSSGPIYKLITTNLGGERRFAAAVARRLQSLGALTKGDRRAATGTDLTQFNFDTPYGRTALRTMYNSICSREIAPGVTASLLTQGKSDFAEFNPQMQECLVQMGTLDMDTIRFGGRVPEKDAGDVGKFLNRILGLPVHKQNKIFNYFTQCLDAGVQAAKREGRYNEGLLDITASSVELVGTPKQVFKDANNSNTVTKHVILKIDRGMSWEKALARLANHQGKNDGFYCSRRETKGKRLYILATQKENSTHLFKIARPNMGVSVFDDERSDLLSKYMPVDKTKAERGWQEQYEHAQEQCMHGAACRNGASCTVGSRCYLIHLLCGGIVTLMSLLESTIAKFGARLQLTKSEMSLRVVRVELNNGERLVGIRFPDMLIPQVEKAIQERKIIERVQLKQTVLVNGTASLVVPPGGADQTDLLHTVVEEEAPVKPKCLHRALTPPVTIKNFFKPLNAKRTATTTPAKTALHSAQEGLNSKLGAARPVELAVMGGNRISDEKLEDVKGKGVSDEKRRVVKEEGISEGKGGVDAGVEKGSVLGGDEKKTVKEALPIEEVKEEDTEIISEEDLPEGLVADHAISLHDTLTLLPPGEQGRKRPLDEDFETKPNRKKPRQSSLANSFAKQASKKEAVQRKKKSCPICGKEFGPTVWNQEINEHIDNCLIE